MNTRRRNDEGVDPRRSMPPRPPMHDAVGVRSWSDTVRWTPTA
ncbi:hypothetical protein BSIN_3950 [Burkholderia singularis]|uniref:Uncharacterized protein n=1 Tax=Burkholderia singularis TaxID=1503053 RepID=A0A238H7G2_9BURK|nr:hypothetical protein BSIN_3950 [Burkholderia singularis]